MAPGPVRWPAGVQCLVRASRTAEPRVNPGSAAPPDSPPEVLLVYPDRTESLPKEEKDHLAFHILEAATELRSATP